MTVKPPANKLSKITLGTRGSPLALAQTELVRAGLAKIDQALSIEIKIIKTSGDWTAGQKEAPLEESQGGKSLFAKELEEALMTGEIDAAVHSMKDMETDLPNGLVIPFMLPRADARDVFLSNIAQKIDDLPEGSLVGTVSPRRASFVLSCRPDLRIVPLRGNVQTRIDKMLSGQVDATILARAGLARLGLPQADIKPIPIEDMVPAAGQGAVGIEIRAEEVQKLSIIGQISCSKTYVCVNLERAVLSGFGGSCRTPVGVHAQPFEDHILLHICLLSPDGSSREETRHRLEYNWGSNEGEEVLVLTSDELGQKLRRSTLARAMHV